MNKSPVTIRRNGAYDRPDHDQRDFFKNRNMIYRLANKIYARAEARAIHMEMEDIVQGLNERYLIAREKFNPEAGVAFSTYFYTAAFNWSNNLFEKEERSASRGALKDSDLGDDEESSFMDGLAGRYGAECVETAVHVQQVMERMSAPCKLLLDMLAGDDPFLAGEFARQRELGVKPDAALGGVMPLFMEVLGVDRRRVREVLRELKQAATEVCG